MHASFLPETRRVLREHGLRPMKRLGQNFLIDPPVRDLIIKVAALKPEDQVVEIGAGTGILTEALASCVRSLWAVEIDPRLFAILKKRIGEREGVTLLQEDALHLDFPSFLGQGAGGGRAKVIANLPYSMATAILLKLLPLHNLFSFLLVMVQQEVAERLLAPPGKKAYGSLTVLCRYHADVSLVAKIPREAFYPRPEVSSALIRLDLLPSPRLETPDPAFFFQVVRAAFAQRRKTLRNALLNALGEERPILEQALTTAGIDPTRRGETLNLEEFGQLSNALHDLRKRMVIEG
ncbi:MAG: 16S rRNA (adenine(1518)-N(6)/adenine(1519)-N(6))-dimethyltransferase RsmA [candidate division NC10 bacterium]|nr:16S rRNA (adenine(1518)-N(6)/adenine(1519)-N(6))-dimethyltransferase RsmA [candidate division NC10 bacterium]